MRLRLRNSELTVWLAAIATLLSIGVARAPESARAMASADAGVWAIVAFGATLSMVALIGLARDDAVR